MKREPSRAEITVNCDALRSNMRFLRGLLHHGTRFCAVLKANAYGHGAQPLARLLEECGADFFAVACLSEALALRRATDLPILILGYTPPARAAVLARNRLTQSVFSADYAMLLAAHAKADGVRLEAHLKIDTGMHRLGFLPEDEVGMTSALSHRSLMYTGVFSHFAVADEDPVRTAAQYRTFADTLALLSARGFSFGIRHIANSAALLTSTAMQADMVRVGLALYGISPLPAPVPALRPALTLTARVVNVRRIGAGEAVGYGGAFVASRPTYIATLPLGYADGIPRNAALEGWCAMLEERRLRFVGRVSMDQCTVASEEPIREGETLLLLGGTGEISVKETARRTGRIPYELLTSLGARIPRVYINR